jgi:hypothetical protein
MLSKGQYPLGLSLAESAVTPPGLVTESFSPAADSLLRTRPIPLEVAAEVFARIVDRFSAGDAGAAHLAASPASSPKESA